MAQPTLARQAEDMTTGELQHIKHARQHTRACLCHGCAGCCFLQVHVPPSLPTDEELALVHCPEYLAAFSSCTLDDQRARR